MKTEHELLLMRQENMYWNSDFKDKRWYRKLFGGEWKHIKLGRDTPDIGMFCTWTNGPIKWWDGYVKVFETEKYPQTDVDTKWELVKEFFKQKTKRK